MKFYNIFPHCCHIHLFYRREKDKLDTEKLRTMTEEERRKFAKENPKVVINQRDKKGKYKFLQKYYHRGAFYMVSKRTMPRKVPDIIHVFSV